MLKLDAVMMMMMMMVVVVVVVLKLGPCDLLFPKCYRSKCSHRPKWHEDV